MVGASWKLLQEAGIIIVRIRATSMLGTVWNGPTRADLSVLILPKKYVYQLNQNFIFSADVEGATDVT